MQCSPSHTLGRKRNNGNKEHIINWAFRKSIKKSPNENKPSTA